jgi:hypothetical protein
MTKARDLANIISGGFTADDIPNLDTAKLTTGTIASARIDNNSLSAITALPSGVGGIALQAVQTTGFTAVAGRGYPCNTTSAGFTVTLPATPSAGDQVQLVDYAGTFDTNALTINPNGEDIEGGTDNLQLTGEREGVILTYIDSTQGWIATSGINEGTDALSPVPYAVDFLVVAGGGGGAGYYWSGGGGAGGYRTSTQNVAIGTAITVTVGDGGVGGVGNDVGTIGSNSSISGSGLTTITSAGGGRGRNNVSGAGSFTGQDGGSGAGGSAENSPTNFGLGNTPSTSPSQGNNGGTGGTGNAAGGGGGAGSVGGNSVSNTGGAGGTGTASSITGSSITRAGGGGGGGNTGGSAGSGGGGAGGSGSGSAGTVNTGGGGGGAGASGDGGAGGKGVVILSVPTANYSSTTTGSPTVTTSGANTIMQFNGSGSYTA